MRHDNNQTGDNHQLDNDSYIYRYGIAYQRNNHVAEREDRYYGETHDYGGLKLGRNGEHRAYTQNLNDYRVALGKWIEKDA